MGIGETGQYLEKQKEILDQRNHLADENELLREQLVEIKRLISTSEKGEMMSIAIGNRLLDFESFDINNAIGAVFDKYEKRDEPFNFDVSSVSYELDELAKTCGEIANIQRENGFGTSAKNLWGTYNSAIKAAESLRALMTSREHVKSKRTDHDDGRFF